MDKPNEITKRTTTRSFLKKWYMTTLGKYQVSNIRYVPTMSIIGMVFYTRTWILIAS